MYPTFDRLVVFSPFFKRHPNLVLLGAFKKYIFKEEIIF